MPPTLKTRSRQGARSIPDLELSDCEKATLAALRRRQVHVHTIPVEVHDVSLRSAEAVHAEAKAAELDRLKEIVWNRVAVGYRDAGATPEQGVAEKMASDSW